MITELETFEQTFLGRCMGVGLRKRGDNDNHVVFVIIYEDDGNWFASENSVSSYWMADGEFGYKFKEKKV